MKTGHLLALALACAPCFAASPLRAAPPRPAKDQPAPMAVENLYGAFLAGRNAQLAGDNRSGAAYLASAATARPDVPILKERAFVALLRSGDVGQAARFAPDDPSSASPLRSLGRLTMAVEAMAAGEGARAQLLLKDDPDPTHLAAFLVLKPWVQAAAGDFEAATSPHESSGLRLVEIMDGYSRARIFELRRRYAEAEALYRAMAEDPGLRVMFAQPFGEFLERRGRAAEAIEVYRTALASSPDDPGLLTGLARAQKRGSAPAAHTLASGAAQSLVIAAQSMAAQRQVEISLNYLRLALRLDPTQDQAWVMVGDALTQARDFDGARDAWGRVQAASRYYADARARIAFSWRRADDLAQAIAVARETVTVAPQDAGSRQVLAELLSADNQLAEASSLLDQVVASGGDRDWQVLFMRASVRDRQGRWAEAEADLNAALKLSPNEPELLNYLGYQWVDRGARVKDGLALVQKAVAMRPNSGAMKDSLGWAYYRLGDYARAAEHLERAVALDPATPEINDHLGDAYWQVGRRDEARYQWSRVLTLNPDPTLKGSVETKLRSGLTAPAKVTQP